ncbi:putative protein kinase RLK-Pelle-DLSV family [Helianthus anomalus]
MFNVDLAQNYLTGTLSPLIGNLTRMQWLTMGINALSGELPPELGQLSDLRLLGYLAPEYAMHGHLTEKADVFGFGVVALEIISGRPNSDPTLEDEQIYLLELAWNLHETNSEVELVDQELSEFDEKEVKRVTRITLLCTQTSPMQRPSMSRVVAMLSGDMEAGGVITRPGYLNGFNFTHATAFKSTIASSGTGSIPSTSHSTVSPSTPDNDSRPMLHNIIEERR